MHTDTLVTKGPERRGQRSVQCSERCLTPPTEHQTPTKHVPLTSHTTTRCCNGRGRECGRGCESCCWRRRWAGRQWWRLRACPATTVTCQWTTRALPECTARRCSSSGGHGYSYSCMRLSGVLGIRALDCAADGGRWSGEWEEGCCRLGGGTEGGEGGREGECTASRCWSSGIRGSSCSSSRPSGGEGDAAR